MPLFGNLTFKVASGYERDEAIRLRGIVYESELGHHGVDEFDEHAHQLVAVDPHGAIVAAIRILGPEQRPFEIERFVDLSRLLAIDRIAAQVGGFWVRAEDRRVQGQSFLPLGMLKLSFEFAKKHHITDFVMRTHIEELKRFYERGFFRVVDDLAFEHPKWGHVYVMHLNLQHVQAKHKESQDPIARFLLSDPESAGIEL